MREPSLIPSFFAKGVEEYPAMFSPESQNFPPCEAHHTPDSDSCQRRNQPKNPPRSLACIAGAKVDRSGGGSIMRERSAKVGKVSQRKYRQIRRSSGGEDHNQKGDIHRRHMGGNAGKNVMGIEIDQQE